MIFNLCKPLRFDFISTKVVVQSKSRLPSLESQKKKPFYVNSILKSIIYEPKLIQLKPQRLSPSINGLSDLSFGFT